MDELKIANYWAKINNWDAYQESYFPKNLHSLPHQRSQWLVEELKKIEFSSILEIGCGCGRNLFHIKNSFPNSKLYGMDISSDAIQFAKSIVDADFVQGSFNDLKKIQQKFDVIFSMASFCYTSPNIFEQNIDTLLKLSTKYIFHFEDFGEGEKIESINGSQNYWKYNYNMSYLKRNKEVQLLDIPNDIQAPAFSRGIKVKI
jgi:SAM-dependent methyltransferase